VKTPEEEFYGDPGPHPFMEALAIGTLVGEPRRYVIEGRWVSKKNSKEILRRGRFGCRFVASSHLYRRWEREAAVQLAGQNGGRPPIEGKVRVRLAIYLDKRQRTPDRDNARSGPFDALQRAGVIRNDSQIVDDPLLIFRDEHRPRVEIMVEELVGE